MGIPVSNSGLLEASKIDMSHQEMDRLVTELEGIWSSFAIDGDGQPTGVEWLPVDHVGSALCNDLGYEDMPEFEDALKGTFEAFLDHLPHVIKEVRNGRAYFQIRPDPPQSSWRACKMTVKIESTKDLWRVCLKSPNARIEIPELEFEISADGKRHIDSIYNHIAAAVYNLGNYVRQAGSSLSEDHKSKIMDTVIALNIFLDVPKPFTWILHDPSGSSEFKPMEDVEVEREGEAAAAGGDSEQQQQPQQPPEQQPAQEQQQSEGAAS